jgi:hypothetical protein
MLTQEEDVDAHALRRQGWTISAIARQLGRDRKTIRAYLNGEQVPGQRRQSPDAFVPYLEYCRQRLADDPRLWASTLFDEVTDLGYEGGYSTFTRALRRYQARPHCEPCHAATGRNVAGDRASAVRKSSSTGWSCRTRPTSGEWASTPICWSGHSGRWRAVLAESEDFSHLVQALDQVVRASWAAPPGGGASTGWRRSAMTTNVGIADWAGAFGDATVAAAMLDRLLHRAAVAGIDGPSYWLRSHQTTADTLRAGVNARVS